MDDADNKVLHKNRVTVERELEEQIAASLLANKNYEKVIKSRRPRTPN